MKEINYIFYLILLLFSFFILITLYIGDFNVSTQISKETIAKVTPVRATIDIELLLNFVPAR